MGSKNILRFGFEKIYLTDDLSTTFFCFSLHFGCKLSPGVDSNVSQLTTCDRIPQMDLNIRCKQSLRVGRTEHWCMAGATHVGGLLAGEFVKTSTSVLLCIASRPPLSALLLWSVNF